MPKAMSIYNTVLATAEQHMHSRKGILGEVLRVGFSLPLCLN